MNMSPVCSLKCFTMHRESKFYQMHVNNETPLKLHTNHFGCSTNNYNKKTKNWKKNSISLCETKSFTAGDIIHTYEIFFFRVTLFLLSTILSVLSQQLQTLTVVSSILLVHFFKHPECRGNQKKKKMQKFASDMQK